MYFDAISSWWVNNLGHCRSEIVEAVHTQFQTMDQVIFAGATHLPAQKVVEELLKVVPKGLCRAFFSDNGSTAVEVGLKMAFQYWTNIGRADKKRLVAFRHAYHGDTFGAMAVSEPSEFNQPFPSIASSVEFIKPPLRGQSVDQAVANARAICEKYDDIAAIIYEPLVQGAGGMLMQDPVALDAMLAVFKEHQVLCIADEVMTGFGRTGKMFACDFLEHNPDIMCLAKGLSGGTFPISVTMASEEVYQTFHSDKKSKAFYHGHSFTGNPLGCAAAIAALRLLSEPSTLAQIENISQRNREFVKCFEQHPSRIAYKDIRCQGTILACEVDPSEHGSGYFHGERDQLQEFFIARGIFARPLGNVIYLLPPYCASSEQLSQFYEAVEDYGAMKLNSVVG